MRILSIDMEKCTECWQCEQLLHGFRSQHHGVLDLEAADLDDEVTAEAVKSVIESCHEQAISLRR